ncbi:MAG: FAD-dependent oxidoreductase [Ruthenibacterium lactatiformans]
MHTAGDTTQKCQFLKNAAYIPYRSLIVPGFDNLLVAGRCFSADQVASASVRVQASVMGWARRRVVPPPSVPVRARACTKPMCTRCRPCCANGVR